MQKSKLIGRHSVRRRHQKSGEDGIRTHGGATASRSYQQERPISRTLAPLPTRATPLPRSTLRTCRSRDSNPEPPRSEHGASAGIGLERLDLAWVAGVEPAFRRTWKPAAYPLAHPSRKRPREIVLRRPLDRDVRVSIQRAPRAMTSAPGPDSWEPSFRSVVDPYRTECAVSGNRFSGVQKAGSQGPQKMGFRMFRRCCA